MHPSNIWLIFVIEDILIPVKFNVCIAWHPENIESILVKVFLVGNFKFSDFKELQPLNSELVWVKSFKRISDKSIVVIFSTLGSYSESKKCSRLFVSSFK